MTPPKTAVDPFSSLNSAVNSLNALRALGVRLIVFVAAHLFIEAYANLNKKCRRGRTSIIYLCRQVNFTKTHLNTYKKNQ